MFGRVEERGKVRASGGRRCAGRCERQFLRGDGNFAAASFTSGRTMGDFMRRSTSALPRKARISCPGLSSSTFGAVPGAAEDSPAAERCEMASWPVVSENELLV
jgi:hypothetical protein